MASKSSQPISEETVGKNFKAFRTYLEKNVGTVELIAYYVLFTPENKKKLRQINKADPTSATREAFDVIEEMEEPGKYMALLRALDDADYPKLVSVLRGLFVPVDDVHRQQINLAARHIFKLLTPTNIVPFLLSKCVISSNDAENIRKTENNESRGNAALDLLFLLPNRNKHWYRLFLEALVEAEHIELAELIDPQTTEKIIKKETGEELSLPVSLQPRNFVERELTQINEDSGDPVSVNNLSAPNMKENDFDMNSLDTTSLLEQKNEKDVQYLVDETKVKLSLSGDEHTCSTPVGSQTKDSLQMSLLYSHTNETSVNALSSSKSQNDNTNVKNEDSTLLKLIYERDPPDGCELKYETNLSNNDNKESIRKSMKDKDLSSADEEKLDNIKINVLDSGAFSEQETKDEVQDEDISLRDYQKELAEAAIKGKNVIIVAPTGSGKTRVALKIIQEHMRRMKGRGIAKVIFLVNQVALANQQAEACSSQLKMFQTKVVSGDTQRSKGECLKDFIDKRDILVVTAQVLLDALVKKEIDCVTKFSLMIYDECHHTHANHPFNQIMSMYLDLKFDEKFDKTALPQIIGLTASVGVGKAKNEDQAVKHIQSLMSNLDAEVICTVQNNMSELRRYVNIPDEETCTVSKRENNVFGLGVTRTMERIEKDMSTSPLVTDLPQATQFEATLRAPAEKGSAQYTQWLSKLWKETAKLRSQEARRFLNPCRAHLEYYNNALIIYNDARVEDALNYLKEMMKRWKESAIMESSDQRLESFYIAMIKLPFRQDQTNPKLEKLREMILRAYRGKEQFENSRGIVFVKTRDLATAIVSWMKETSELKDLNPIKFVGQNESADKGGMTKVEQDDALKYFRNGKHKLIVATSVAEEGLDISKCNLVIRYDHVTNEIAMVQSRGRARAEDSKYVLVAEQGKGMAEKEELNMIREILMRKAIIRLQRHIIDSPSAFAKEQHKLQEEAKLDRDLKAVARKGKRVRSGEFELRCLRCNIFICMSSDVKKIQNAHHVCVDESLKDRVDYVRGTSKYIDETIQIMGKLICMECGFDLGGIIIHKTLEFPVLKIEKYLLIDMNGRQDTCTQWKKAPFEPQPLTAADFRAILLKRQETGEI